MMLQLINIASNSIVNGNNVGDIECTCVGFNINSNSADYLFSITQSGEFTCKKCQIDNSNVNNAMTSLFSLSGSTNIVFNASDVVNCKAENVINLSADSGDFKVISTNIENIKLATTLLAIQGTNDFTCTDSTFW